MKRLVLAFLSLIVISVGASAMTYEQAREQALFLTDKMAYELNLTPEQYDAAYEVNFDYLRGVTTADDVFGVYWEHRNIDLGYILLDWQYRMFTECLWFYRPLYWDAGVWHFRIYGRYPYRDVFYFDRPMIYINYYGGHCWRHCGGSWYSGRTYGHPSRIGEHGGSGMRNNWDGRNRSYSGHSSSTAHSGSFTPSNRNSSHATGSNATGSNGGRSDGRGASATTHDGSRGSGNGAGRADNDNRRGGANSAAAQGGHSGSFHRSSDGTSTHTTSALSSSRSYGTSSSRDKGATATRSNDNQVSHQSTVTPSSTRNYGSSSSSTRSYGSSSSSTRSYGTSSSSARSYGSSSSSAHSYGPSSSSRSYGGYSGGSHSYGGGRSGGFSGGRSGGFSGGHSGGFGGHGGRGR